MTEPIKDIVIDANVMCLYDKPKYPSILALFEWLKSTGTLAVSKSLITEYMGSSNQLILVLINHLSRDNRYHMYSKSELNAFTLDRHYNYTCNGKDVPHARLVLISYRKRLVSFDGNLINDINKFKKVNGIKPCACREPGACCLC